MRRVSKKDKYLELKMESMKVAWKVAMTSAQMAVLTADCLVV